MTKFPKIITIFIAIFITACSSNEKESSENVIKKKRINPNVTERVRDSKTDGLFTKALGSKSSNFEFATSNVLWRASLDTISFMPLSTVSYSGGVIITDWYGKNDVEMLKFTIRFLSNELALSSVEVSGFKKICENKKCNIEKTNNKINAEIKNKIFENAKKLKILDENKKK